jgi:hypothetical protein
MGVHCWECKVVLHGNHTWMMLGVCVGIPNIDNSFRFQGSWGVITNNGFMVSARATEPGLLPAKSGDVIRLRLNYNSQTLEVKNVTEPELDCRWTSCKSNICSTFQPLWGW